MYSKEYPPAFWEAGILGAGSLSATVPVFFSNRGEHHEVSEGTFFKNSRMSRPEKASSLFGVTGGGGFLSSRRFFGARHHSATGIQPKRPSWETPPVNLELLILNVSSSVSPGGLSISLLSLDPEQDTSPNTLISKHLINPRAK